MDYVLLFTRVLNDDNRYLACFSEVPQAHLEGYVVCTRHGSSVVQGCVSAEFLERGDILSADVHPVLLALVRVRMPFSHGSSN